MTDSQCSLAQRHLTPETDIFVPAQRGKALSLLSAESNFFLLLFFSFYDYFFLIFYDCFPIAVQSSFMIRLSYVYSTSGPAFARIIGSLSQGKEKKNGSKLIRHRDTHRFDWFRSFSIKILSSASQLRSGSLRTTIICIYLRTAPSR